MESLWHDVRQTLRMMVGHKAFTAAALLTLALGIGANAAVFSMVYGVLLRPLPYDEPERLMRISEEHPGGNSPLTGAFLSDLTLDAWLPTSRTVQGVAAFSGNAYTIGREDPIRLSGAQVSPALFHLLRVRPAAGRFFEEGEAIEGSDAVVILGYGFWQERFGASHAALGQTLNVDGRSRVIIGVAPPGFAFPNPDSAFWLPYVLPKPNADPTQRGMRVMQTVARLRPGVTPEQAAAEGTAAARRVTRPFVADMLFGKGAPVEVRVRPIVAEMTSALRPALLVLMAGVVLVLLVACANVANLLLARGLARQREMAVRAALGAPWRRLARQLLTESSVIAMAGGTLGLLLAWSLIRALPAVAPDRFPRLDAIHLDWRVLSFAVGVSCLAGLLAGVLPAMRGAQARLESALRTGDRRATSGSGHALRASLLVAEAALAVVLIVGAALLVRSFTRLLQVDAGFTPSNALIAQVFLPTTENAAGDRGTPFFDTLLPRLQQMPGVVAAGVGNMAPFGRSTAISGFEIPGPDGKPVRIQATSWTVTPRYGAALGLRLRSGRFLEPGDATAPTHAMVVNEEFVRLYLRDGNPVVGRRYPNLLGHKGDITEIVGVVGNVLKDGLDRRPQPEIYGLAGDWRGPGRFLVIRTTGDPLAIAADVRRLVRETDPRAALDGVGSLTGAVSASVAQPRFAALMLALFAGLALAVAATGLYGVLSYSVSERRREIGVRSALGATRGRLIGLVLRQGLGFTVGGLVLGLAAAALSSRLLSTLLFGVTPYDAMAFSIAPLVLIAVALFACLVPAWRAAATDPSEALRAE
jgi:putative ABC transport system permease protein